MPKFTVEPLCNALGAEIIGLDLREELDAETIKDLRDAWLEHLVLLVRGQDLNEAQQVRFAGYFGEPYSNTRVEEFSHTDGMDKHILPITNITKDGKPIGVLREGELQFHSDSAFHEEPLMATVLYAVELPSEGGNTLFSNMYAAYETLSADDQETLCRYRAMNAYDYGAMTRRGRAAEDSPHAVHPVIRTHPETGRKVVYVNKLMTEEIVDLDPAESDATLERLFALAENRDFIYEHKWRLGDILIWDNRCTQHARTDFPPDQIRYLKRVGIAGDRPF